MRLIDRLLAETAGFHADADEDAVELLGPVTAADYRRYLARTYGFVCPVERSITTTPEVERYIDLRRFNKHELLERDLMSLHVTRAQLNALPHHMVPLFDTPEQALGWAFVIERGVLGHGNLFRHLASALPGEIAFASLYLKCYFGAVGDMWSSFAGALDSVAARGNEEAVVDAAKAGFRAYRHWRHLQDDRDHTPTPETGEQQTA